MISGRRQGELDETIRLARERTQEAQLVAVVGDLGKPEEVDALFEVIRERFGACLSFSLSLLTSLPH